MTAVIEMETSAPLLLAFAKDLAMRVVRRPEGF